MEDHSLIYSPIGGAGEIGMNMYAYGFKKKNKVIITADEINKNELSLLLSNNNSVSKSLKNIFLITDK